MSEQPCPFCEINTGRAPATFVHEWSDTIAIIPLNPVVDGHTLVIPKTHVTDFADDPDVTGATARRAGQAAARHPCPTLRRARGSQGRGVGAVSKEGGIRLIGGRHMQCKDIPDETFLDAVRRTPGTASSNWRMRWNVSVKLEEAVGPVPENLLLAKARKLIAAGKLGGCDCGCRGDWHLPDECNGYNCCAQPT